MGTGVLPVGVEEEHAEESDGEGEVERVLGQHDASNQERHAGDGRCGPTVIFLRQLWIPNVFPQYLVKTVEIK